MSIIVQKFGGTSVSTEESRQHCLQHIKRELESGNKVAVVVSAMGRKGDPYATDTLLSLLGENSHLPDRERDLLLSTGEFISASVFSNMLWNENIPNTVLTGGQAGIQTDHTFGNANITSLNPANILSAFEEQSVVVVTGFQGIDENGDLTTLGRGGSDTSGTALGAALNAERVDIFTDVKGVYTADPRIVEHPMLLENVTYNEICNLAYLGAKVIHPRAVEMAMQHNIPIRVRSTFSDDPGTLVFNFTEMNKPKDIKERLITGITQAQHITQIKVMPENGETNLQSDVFKLMYDHHLSIDFININTLGVVFTVSDSIAKQVESLLKEAGFRPQLTPNCSKVSVVGAGIAGVPGVMFKIIDSLESKNIPVLQCADSHTTIWVLIKGEQTKQAVQSLHHTFQLDQR